MDAVRAVTTANKPAMKAVFASLEKFKQHHVTVRSYFEHKSEQQAEQQPAESKWRSSLLAWCGIQLAKCLRRAHEGLPDHMFIGLSSNPPQGRAPGSKLGGACQNAPAVR